MIQRPRMIAAVVGFGIGFASALLSAPAERFDHIVRNNFFAGFAGNRQALEQAMKVSEEVIQSNPSHAEALVWHGAGLYYLAGGAFQKGEIARGMELYQRAFAEMDKAVQLAPDNVGVRIPRGASLLAAAVSQPLDDRVRREIGLALEDYEHVFQLQRNSLDKLGEHPLGQLLLGLADGYSQLGDAAKAGKYFEMIEQKLPGTEYARRAASWKQNGMLSRAERQCAGCHAGPQGK